MAQIGNCKDCNYHALALQGKMPIQFCPPCKKHGKNFEPDFSKLRDLTDKAGYILTPIETTGSAIGKALVPNDIICVIVDLHGTGIGHAATLTKADNAIYYLDSASDINKPNLKDEAYIDNKFTYAKSQKLKAGPTDVAGIEQFVDYKLNSHLDENYLADKKSQFKNHATAKETYSWIEHAYTIKEKPASGSVKAKEEYYNLLIDYEYDAAVVEARESRDIKLLKQEKKKVLRAKERMKNAEQGTVKHKIHKKHKYH